MSNSDSPKQPDTISSIKRDAADGKLQESNSNSGKDKLVGVVLILVFVGLGVGMIVHPDLISDDVDPVGRKTQGILNLIDLVWSRPVGGLTKLLGLLMTPSLFWKSSGHSGTGKPVEAAEASGGD